MEHKPNEAFAVWITGLPASGKSTIAASLKAQLSNRGIDVAVLESDVLRKVLTFRPRYDEEERQAFYRQLTYIGALLIDHGVPVIFDATANRAAYREPARKQFAKFLEVYVDCPIEVCMARDPKGIYRMAQEGKADNVPGVQAQYEAPVSPDLVLNGETEDPESAAGRVIEKLIGKGYLPPTWSRFSASRSPDP